MSARTDMSISIDKDVLPDIIAGLRDVLLRVEGGEDISKITASMAGTVSAPAFSGPGISLLFGSALPSSPTEHITQLAAYSLPEDRSNPLLICSSAGFLEVLRGVPDEETEEFKTLHRVAHADRVTAIQVAEELRVAFCSSARPNRTGVSLRSLHHATPLAERTFLPTPHDATACVAVSHGIEVTIFDLQTLRPLPFPNFRTQHPISCLTSIEQAPVLACGSVAGSIELFDFRTQGRPIISLQQHSRCITGLESITPITMVSAAADGALCLWDIRRPVEPTRSLVPDGKSVIALRMRPNRSGVALATLHGLYYADFAQLDLSALALAPSPQAAEVFPVVSWLDNRLYALHLSGSVLLYGEQ